MSNSLGRFVGPDLGPNCCQGYQQTTLLDKELKIYFIRENSGVSLTKTCYKRNKNKDFNIQNYPNRD